MKEPEPAFHAVRALFDEVCDLGAAEREARLARVDPALARHVRALLAEDAAEGRWLDRPPLPAAEEPEARVPERIGRFRILERIGTGGTGAVYKARQDSPDRLVALKVLRSVVVTPALRRRFELEAQVLGRLDHPGIARVFEAGTADTGNGEEPWFAMELVDGRPLTVHAREARLDLAARLALLARVCDAVQHAHKKGVVHRDLKPGNVLVDAEGNPKVLDFGMARTTATDTDLSTMHTREGVLIGTLPYMSPEQFAGDPAAVGTRADVYALGVLGYELCAGVLPHDVGGRAVAEVARMVAEDEPTRLGECDASLRGDVETIIGKAMAKEPGRRYSTADELASDLRRFLRNEPIVARPPTLTYQLSKFARRNKGLVGGVALAFAVLLVGTVVSTAMYFQKSRLLEEKAAEAETANQAVAFLEGIFAQADPFAQEELSVRDVARQAAERIGNEFGDRPVLRGRLLNALGKVFLNLELDDEAEPLLVEALALRGQQYGEDSVEYAETLERVAYVRELGGYADEAERMYRRVVAIREARLGPSIELASALSNLASLLARRGADDEATALDRRALALHERIEGPQDPHTLAVRLNVGTRLWGQGRLAEAEALFRGLAEGDSRVTERLRIAALGMLGECLRSQLRSAEAVEPLRRAAALAEARYGRDARVTREVRGKLANVLSELGRGDEVQQILRELYDAALAQEGADSPAACSAAHDLAYALHDFDQREAEALYLDAIGCFERSLGPDAWQLFQAQHNLSVLYLDLGRLDEASALEREALEGRARVLGEADPQTLVSWTGLGNLLLRTGELDECIEVRRKILALTEPAQGEHSRLTQDARIDLANALGKAGEREQAEGLLERAWSAVDGMPDPGATPRRIAGTFVSLYEGWGRPADAERWRDELRRADP